MGPTSDTAAIEPFSAHSTATGTVDYCARLHVVWGWGGCWPWLAVIVLSEGVDENGSVGSGQLMRICY
jgi:hypothetical protein